MGNYRLHYASIEQGETDDDIPVFKFNTNRRMIDFIDEKCIGKSSSIVWLLAKENSNDIFISEKHLSIQDFLLKKYTWNTVGDYFLQEYKSYEEAYSVALSMVEISPLCYEAENK